MSSAEAVSQDLRATGKYPIIILTLFLGNDKVDDLGAMQRKYKRDNENKREDIGVLRKVIIQKDNEIADLT